MHIFVVNLEKDKERRESIIRQSQRLNLRVEFIQGVLGSALSKEELATCYDDKKAKRNLCMSLVPAHIGCSLSHTKIYREIVTRNLPCALILEDDVILPDSLPQTIADLKQKLMLGRPEVILLSPALGYENSSQARAMTNGARIVPFKGGYFTSSYIVTNNAARALLKELYPVGDVADCWARMDRYKVVDLFIVTPPVVVQDKDSFGSSTDVDTNRAIQQLRLTGHRKLLFKARRAVSKLRDFFYGIYRRKFVPYCGIDITK